MQVTPAVLGTAPLRPALRVTVTNNSTQTTHTVARIDWSLGQGSGSVEVNADIEPGASYRRDIAVDASELAPWTPYDANVTAAVAGLPDLKHAGTATFDPVVARTIAIDGTVDDGVAGLSGIDFSNDGHWVSLVDDQPRSGPADSGGQVWLFHDEDMLYLVARIDDQTFSQDYTGGDTWQGDSLQFALAAGAPDAAGAPYRFELALTSDGPQLNCDLAPAGVDLGLVSDAVLGIEQGDGSTVYEAGIPWTALPLDESSGIFAFTLLYNDNDGNGRKGYLEWASGLGSGSVQPSQFYACQLIRP